MRQEIKLNQYIDHTNLKPSASDDEIRQLCSEANKYNFRAVCVNPSKIDVCVETLRDSRVLICTVVGFPLGQNTIITKIAETIDAIQRGADEIDMVINIAELKNFNKNYCIREINEVVKAANGKLVKVIVETALLSEKEKIFAFEVVNESNANYIKTSTGFAKSGAQIEDIELWNKLRQQQNSNLLIKAAGGICEYDDLIKFILAGANRIGSSKSVQMLKNHNNSIIIEKIVKYRIIEDDKEKKNDLQVLDLSNKPKTQEVINVTVSQQNNDNKKLLAKKIESKTKKENNIKSKKK